MPVSEPLLGHAPSSRSLYGTFTVSICTVITVLLIGTALFTRFSDEAAGAPGVERFYMYLVHVLIMVFGGFGFLMTFLRRFQLSAVGLNFFLSCLTMAAYLLVGGGISQGLFTWKARVSATSHFTHTFIFRPRPPLASHDAAA